MTLTLVSPDGRPIMRVRPAPSSEPPYDDERPVDAGAVCVGQLEIAGSIPAGARPGTPVGARPSTPVGAHPTHPTSPTDGRPGTQVDQAPGAQTRRPAHPVAESRLAAQRFVGICVEVLNGFRPITHLRPLATPVDYATITNQLTRRAVRTRMDRACTAGGNRSVSAGRAAASATAGVALLRIRVCEPRTGVAEAAVVLAHGEAVFAMAVRLEHRRGRWCCALLQVI